MGQNVYCLDGLGWLWPASADPWNWLTESIDFRVVAACGLSPPLVPSVLFDLDPACPRFGARKATSICVSFDLAGGESDFGPLDVHHYGNAQLCDAAVLGLWTAPSFC